MLTDDWGLLADAVTFEYERAVKLFPGANNNTLALCEEHGELVKAVIDHSQGKATLEEAYEELVQTMAMCLRLYFQGDDTIGLPPLRSHE